MHATAGAVILLILPAVAQTFDPLRSGLLPQPLPREHTAVVADIDGDGDLDLVRVSDWSFWYAPELLINDGEGRFTVTRICSSG